MAQEYHNHIANFKYLYIIIARLHRIPSYLVFVLSFRPELLSNIRRIHFFVLYWLEKMSAGKLHGTLENYIILENNIDYSKEIYVI